MTLLTQLKGPISKSTLADSVYQQILEAILSGALASGTELSEVTLAAELGVSRTPVHEALLRLTADGLVEHLPNRCDRVMRFTDDDVRAIYDMRLVLECAAVERAAVRMDADELADLIAEADVLAAAPNSRTWPTRALDFDVRLHAAFAAASGNERLRAEIVKYRHLVRAFCRLSGTPSNLRQAAQEHQGILKAMKARDPAAARRAMAAHVEARLQAVLEAKAETPA